MSKQSILALLISLCIPSVSSLKAEDTPAPLAPDAPVTTTTSYSNTADGYWVTNADGSKTWVSTSTVTNNNTGVSRTANRDLTVQKTDTGAAWTGNTSATNSLGGSTNRQTTGSSVNNGDGTGTWASTTDGQHVNAAGKETDWTTNRNGAWQSDGAGGGTWQKNTDTTVSNGATLDRQTTGTTTKTADGRTWASTTNGEYVSPKGKETDWTTNRNGQVTRTGDGNATWTNNTDTTLSNGATIDRQTTGSTTKTADGRDWTSTTTGEAKGPNGKETDWTTTRSTDVTKNADGSKTIEHERDTTTSNGKSVDVTSTETLTKGTDGKWHEEGNTTRTVEKTPPTTPPASPLKLDTSSSTAKTSAPSTPTSSSLTKTGTGTQTAKSDSTSGGRWWQNRNKDTAGSDTSSDAHKRLTDRTASNDAKALNSDNKLAGGTDREALRNRYNGLRERFNADKDTMPVAERDQWSSRFNDMHNKLNSNASADDLKSHFDGLDKDWADRGDRAARERGAGAGARGRRR